MCNSVCIYLKQIFFSQIVSSCLGAFVFTQRKQQCCSCLLCFPQLSNVISRFTKFLFQQRARNILIPFHWLTTVHNIRFLVTYKYVGEKKRSYWIFEGSLPINVLKRTDWLNPDFLVLLSTRTTHALWVFICQSASLSRKEQLLLKVLTDRATFLYDAPQEYSFPL